MTFWTAASVRRATGGAWARRPDDREITGVSIDTRTLKPGQAFVALAGERHDGHEFLAEAVRAGASLLVVEDGAAAEAYIDLRAEDGPGVLRVADARAALVRLATAYRKALTSTRVIAVTGSNGKTTTVRLIDAALSGSLRGTASVKSYNNELGVPLTILSAKPSDHYLVCEVGMSGPGEIARLARIVEPNVAVITSIGRAHIGAFDDELGIAREKASLLSYLAPGGVAVVTADTGLLDDHVRTAPHAVRFGLSADADLRVTSVEHAASGAGLRFVINDRLTYELPMVGEPNALNAAAAIAVARRFGLDDAAIAAGLAAVRPPPMRLERIEIGGVTVLNDSYNASPESVVVALETFAALARDARRRVIVIGDMLELGETAPAAHVEAGLAMLERGAPDELVTVGPMALFIAEAVSTGEPKTRVAIHSELTDDACRRIASRLEPGDAVLVKGSRRVGLERVVDAIKHRAAMGSLAATPAP